MKTSMHAPSALHKKFRDEMIAVMQKYSGGLSAEEMLALASHLVGQIIALQDQRIFTPEMVMQIVKENIEQGNQEAQMELAGPAKGSA